MTAKKAGPCGHPFPFQRSDDHWLDWPVVGEYAYQRRRIGCPASRAMASAAAEAASKLRRRDEDFSDITSS
jgi:hypothetical protein